MKKLSFKALFALILGFGIVIAPARAEEEESVCAAETIDGLLDKAAKLAEGKKYDEIIDECFTEEAVKKLDAQSKDMLKAMFALPEFNKMLAGCKGDKSKVDAGGKTATCTLDGAVGAKFVLADEEWYLSAE